MAAKGSRKSGAATPGMATFGREQIAEIQRARILAAMVEVACEHGAGDVTVAHVVDRCGVSRRTFYELFDDRDDCLLAAFDDAVSQMRARVVPAFESDGRWHERVRAALVELLAFCEREPRLAHVVLVESQAGAMALQERRVKLQRHLVAAIDEGRKEAQKGTQAGPLIAEGVVGGVLSVIASRLASAENGLELLGLTGALMSMIVLPYLGAAAARREAQRPAPARPASTGPEGNGAIALHELNMRLTYRTMRVLLAVASQPDASNRAIGDAAEITDQGQISKLLNRLERIGLVHNTGAGAGKGMPNAWTLTEKGRRITDGIGIAESEESQP